MRIRNKIRIIKAKLFDPEMVGIEKQNAALPTRRDVIKVKSASEYYCAICDDDAALEVCTNYGEEGESDSSIYGFMPEYSLHLCKKCANVMARKMLSYR